VLHIVVICIIVEHAVLGRFALVVSQLDVPETEGNVVDSPSLCEFSLP
jgi:hypothetical protein